MADQVTRLEQHFAGRSLHRSSVYDHTVYDRCTPECRTAIVERIKKWLAADPDTVDGVVSLHLQDADGKSLGIDGLMNWSRAEQCFMHCANGWQVFRVAWSSQWPEIISLPMGVYSLNDHREDDRPPNFVRHERECKPLDEPVADIPVMRGTL